MLDVILAVVVVLLVGVIGFQLIFGRLGGPFKIVRASATAPRAERNDQGQGITLRDEVDELAQFLAAWQRVTVDRLSGRVEQSEVLDKGLLAHVAKLLGAERIVVSLVDPSGLRVVDGHPAVEVAVVIGDPFELAILDYQMPEMDGIGLARAIRKDPKLSGVRLVLLTSSARPGDTRAAQEAGIRAFLTKPARIADLYDCLATLLAPTDDDIAAAVMTANLRYSFTEASPGERARVLVVDDNPVNQRVSLRMLEKMGHSVDVADNGIGALAALGRVRYDAVLMDCQMPEMDGFEACREIRRREGSERHTPIIAMTAGAMSGDEEKCLDAGMDAYLSKPVKVDALAAMITEWTARSKPTPDLNPIVPGLLDQTYVSGLRELGADEFDKLIRLFLKDGAARVTGLRTAQTANDTKAMVKLAHSLKGSASSFGAGTLAARCGELQARATSADPAEDARLIDSVDAEFALASAALLRELEPAPAPARKNGARNGEGWIPR